MKKVEYTNNPVCPHCKNVIENIWEHEFVDEQLYINCDNCDKPLEIYEHIQRSYSTYEN